MQRESVFSNQTEIRHINRNESSATNLEILKTQNKFSTPRIEKKSSIRR